jgi:hypothetical protein
MILTAVGLLVLALLLLHGISQHNDALRRRAALLADLSRLLEAQEDAMARDGQYAAHLEREGGIDTARFAPSPDVKVRFDRLAGDSWRAVVTDTVLRADPRSCGLFKGEVSASPHRAVVLPGVPACW